MCTQHARRFSRRRFLGELTLAGTAGPLGLHARRVAAEPPPETTKITLVQTPSICLAPQYVAEELLRAEGFTEVHYIKKQGGKGIETALVSGEANINMHFGAPTLIRLDAGDPLVILAGGHIGCFELIGSERVRAIPIVPIAVERAAEIVAGLWFVNLVNFMDGIDWMTVAETVPCTASIFIFALLGAVRPPAGSVALALCGAMLGFAPFNRPVAKLFLGDVGSLPIGLLLGWSLLELVYHGQLTAALLLPLYYFSDATVTLLRRLAKRELFWTAHRSHFYQRATDNGFTVLRVVSEVFALNVGLAALAILSAMTQSWIVDISCACIGGIAVASVLYRFSRQR